MGPLGGKIKFIKFHGENICPMKLNQFNFKISIPPDNLISYRNHTGAAEARRWVVLLSSLRRQMLMRARPAALCALLSDVVWRRDTAAASCVRTRAMGGGLDLHSRFFDWRAVRFGSHWFFGVTAGAALASSLRGSLWWLGVRWLEAGIGPGRWRAAERTCVFIALWRRACCGAYPLFYRSSAF